MNGEAYQPPAEALAGKIVVVAGARDGLARAIADKALASGAAGVTGLGAWCAASGPEISRHAVDLGDEAALTAALGEIKARFGRLDVLFNCVAEPPAPAEDFMGLSGEAFDRAFTAPLHHAFLVLKHTIPLISGSDGAAIVNVVDAAPSPGSQPFAFAAAATAVEGMSKTAAVECGPLDIRVNCVRPSRPGESGQAGAAANLAVFLASNAASFITGSIFAFATGADT